MPLSRPAEMEELAAICGVPPAKSPNHTLSAVVSGLLSPGPLGW